MKLYEYKNEEAAEKLVGLLDMLEPIAKEKVVLEAMKDSPLSAAKAALKTHGKEVIDILAYVDGVPRAEYKVSAIGILKKTIKLFTDDETPEVFTSAEQTAES